MLECRCRNLSNELPPNHGFWSNPVSAAKVYSQSFSPSRVTTFGRRRRSSRPLAAVSTLSTGLLTTSLPLPTSRRLPELPDAVPGPVDMTFHVVDVLSRNYRPLAAVFDLLDTTFDGFAAVLNLSPLFSNFSTRFPDPLA